MFPQRLPYLEKEFPTLLATGYDITSEPTWDYNCIAWAGGDVTRWWWPTLNTNAHWWPTNLPFDTKLATFIELYRQECGYEPCENGNFEKGFDKIVIYGKSGDLIQHAARQLPNGKWTSKCGPAHDITHYVPTGVEGHEYGKVIQFMKRPHRK